MSIQLARKQLDEAIENLYTTFRRYRLHGKIDGCPCCVGDADNRLIRSNPLRQLDPSDLLRYAAKAITTWGSSYDFRHFLPRIFELIVLSPDSFLDQEIVIGKLGTFGSRPGSR